VPPLPRPVEWLRLLAPYLAVLLGMVVLHNAWLAVLLYHALILVTAKGHWRLTRLRQGWHAVGWLGIALSAAAGPLIYFMWPWIGGEGIALGGWLESYGLSRRAFLILLPYFSLAHPVLEELHWSALRRDGEFPPWLAHIAFAGYHLVVLGTLVSPVWLPIVFVTLSMSSCLWAWIDGHHGGASIPLASHAAADIAIILAAGWLAFPG
jgi:hypothetical protein